MPLRGKGDIGTLSFESGYLWQTLAVRSHERCKMQIGWMCFFRAEFKMQDVNWKKRLSSICQKALPLFVQLWQMKTHASVFFLLCGGRYADPSITSVHFFGNVNGLLEVFRHLNVKLNTLWDVILLKPTAKGKMKWSVWEIHWGEVLYTTHTAVLSQGRYLLRRKISQSWNCQTNRGLWAPQHKHLNSVFEHADEVDEFTPDAFKGRATVPLNAIRMVILDNGSSHWGTLKWCCLSNLVVIL